jgi:endonuclease/exonuclease/phosphatase family metal-dependent hydrolase
MSSFKVITLNIWNYNRFDERKQRIIDFLREEDADVVALQEIRDDARFNVEGEHQAKQLNDALNYPFIVFESMMDLNEIDKTPLLPRRVEGLALLSKHPVTSHSMIPLASHPDDKFQRKILHCRADINGHHTDFVVVHFSPHELFSELHLVETLRLVEHNNWRAVILGDFNIHDHGVLLRQIDGKLISSFSHTPYVSLPSRQWTLDYVLIPPEYRFESVRASKEGLSDHRGVITRIRTR